VHRPRVLVADDDADLRATIAEVLNTAGMRVVEARSGAEALGALAEARFDLVVTDVMMPLPLGVEMAAMARSAGEGVPILVITGLREEWVQEAVSRLQLAELLTKPFSAEQLLDRVNALLARRQPRGLPQGEPSNDAARPAPRVFPPALVSVLRDRLRGDEPFASAVDDETFVELLTIVFFAGLETEEGERRPVRVVFAGRSAIAHGRAGGTLYRWSAIRFRRWRPFSVIELAKLAAVSAGGRVFVEVRCDGDDLAISGLAREGVNLEGDPFLKIVSPKPGALSLRSGRTHLLEYEHGRILGAEADVVLAPGPVRRALEASALASGVPVDVVSGYVDAVHSLVEELSAHGSGGILVCGTDERPEPPGESGYGTFPDVSVASILGRLHALAAHDAADAGLERMVRVSMLSELEHTIEEVGALTALDGATVLDRGLALVGFGIVLPVRADVVVLEASHANAGRLRRFDLVTRGTRHRAAATYARDHAGCVVFVASQDGHLSCMHRAPQSRDVVLWHLRSRALSRR
jgi:CheY-like chemotaxis protein